MKTTSLHVSLSLALQSHVQVCPPMQQHQEVSSKRPPPTFTSNWLIKRSTFLLLTAPASPFLQHGKPGSNITPPKSFSYIPYLFSGKMVSRNYPYLIFFLSFLFFLSVICIVVSFRNEEQMRVGEEGWIQTKCKEMKETLKFRLEAICFPHTAVSSGLMSEFITMQTPNHKPPDDRGETKKVLGLNRNIPWRLKHAEKRNVYLYHLGGKNTLFYCNPQSHSTKSIVKVDNLSHDTYPFYF